MINWIEEWKKSKNFRVENDRIKKKSYLFSAFPKTNTFGFQTLSIRNLLIGDFYSRYQRMVGYNVLFPVGYDSLGLSSFLENKKRSNVINDDIITIFEQQMLNLGIGIDYQNNIDLKNDNYISLLQLAFIELYEKGYIKYSDIEIYQDKTGKKWFDLPKYRKNLSQKKVKAFYLDITSIRDNVLSKIDELNVNNEIKTELKDIFDYQKSLDITFFTTNGNKIIYNFKEPEYIGAISFILLHPDYIDFTEYTLYEEYQAIEKYLSDDNTNDFGVFSGTYAINPLTGKKIPIFISVKYDCPIYIGNPYLNADDRTIAKEEGLMITDVFFDGVYVESDFLNGISVEQGRNLIIEQFTQADIASCKYYYGKDKILLSSLDSLGALIPFFIDNEDNLYSLKNNLPFVLSAKFRPVLSDDIDVSGNMIQGSINHIFVNSMLPFLALLYDDVGANLSIFSNESIRIFKEWNGANLYIISKDDLYEYIFVPLCILSIIEKEKKVKLPSLFKNIILVNPTFDDEYHKISKQNNNLFDLNNIIKKYSADAVRMYFFAKNPNEDFIFNEAELASIKNLKKSIEEYYNNPLDKSNISKEFDLFKEKCILLLKDYNINNYVEYVINFYKETLSNNNISKEEGLDFLKILYPICPFLVEDIYRNIYKGKYLISDDGFII